MRADRIVLIITLLAVTALGLVFLAIGLQRADQLASTVGGLTGAAALGITLWLWLAERSHRSPSAPGSASAPGPTEAVPATGAAGTSSQTGKYAVRIERAKGVQIGDGNVQHNDFRSTLRGRKDG